MTPQRREPGDRAFAVAIGAEIAYWRRRSGLNRGQLAALVGKSSNTIGRYERGDTVPDVTETYELATALGVPVSQLIERAEQSMATAGRHTIADEVERNIHGRRPADDEDVDEAPPGDPAADVG